MKQPKAPSLNCEDRQVGCHIICDKYIKFNHECEIFRAEKQRIAEENRMQNGIKLRRLSKTFGIIYGAMGIKAEDLEEIK